MISDSINFAIVADAFSSDPRRNPRLSHRAGFAGLQFDAYAPSLNLTELSATGRREFRHLLAAHEQQLAGLRVGLGAKGFSAGSDIDRILARIDTAMETAVSLGTRALCIEVGPLPTESSSDIDAAFIELGKRADRYGIIAAFRSDLASFAALERALKSADCPWFGIDLDPVALLQDDWSIDEFFSRLGPLVRHVRGRDALANQKRTQATPIGQGSTDWPTLLANLEASGFRGWITIDPLELANRSVATEAGLMFLQRLMSGR